jgi:zinc protease
MSFEDNGTYREFKLDNGLLVALLNTPTQTISGRLRTNHGAIHETPGEEGIAHLLEHGLVYGGTQKYDPEAADAIKATFGNYNAFTGLDRTFFPVHMLAEDLELYLDFVSDLAFNPRLDATRIQEEKGRVLREMADMKSNPGFRDQRAYQKALFGDGPESYFIAGTEDVINNATPNDLRAFHSRGYHANNMDLVLVGGLPENVEDLARKYFYGRPTGEGRKFEFPALAPLERQVILHTSAPELYNHDTPQDSSAQFSVSFIVPDGLHEDSYALSMLVNILGGDANSRLFRTVSQRKQLAYGVGGSYNGNNNRGIVNIGGSIISARQDGAFEAIFDEMQKLKSEPVNPEEIERIKRAMKYGTAKQFESNEGHLGEIERRLDYGFTTQRFLENLDGVTPERVVEVANRYLPTRNGNYVLLIRDPLKK